MQQHPVTTVAPLSAPAERVRLSEVVAALSYALDITEGQPEGHAVKSCLLGMRVAEQIGLPMHQRPALFYALLLKDLGCSSNAARICQLFGADDFGAKQDMKTSDWPSLPQAALYALRNVAPNGSPVERAARLLNMGLQGGPLAARKLFELRCDRGARIVFELGFGLETAAAIYALDEHWDGHGYPEGLRRAQIPLLARILCLAQTVEIFAGSFGMEAARSMVQRRRGSWFDPALADAMEPLWADKALWLALHGDARAALTRYSPDDRTLETDDQLLDRLAEAFAQVIDAKSPWTFAHSTGVAEKALGVGQLLGMDPDELRDLRRAALLHDIGKLGISNLILDKPGKLDADEIAAMRQHPVYTRRILERVASFRTLAYTASLHHERLDGRGYPYGLADNELPLAARILAVADCCDALCAARPYHAARTWAEARQIMERDVGVGLCPVAFEALCSWMARS